jgi:hypothetical protein
MNLQATRDRTTNFDRFVMVSMAVCFLVTSAILVVALAASSPGLQKPVVHTSSTIDR